MSISYPIEDKLLSICEELENMKNIKFPCKCPICKKKSAHLYYNRRIGEKVGGIWIWCSSYKNFFHGSSDVPLWWENCSEVSSSLLTADPGILEDLKDKVDEHTNFIFKNIIKK